MVLKQKISFPFSVIGPVSDDREVQLRVFDRVAKNEVARFTLARRNWTPDETLDFGS
jgi:hypothetical protein